MSVETQPSPSSLLAAQASRWSRLTEIKVEVEDETAAQARPRFAWNMGEVSGSLGDLGTFLPHIVGAITVVKMDPTGILTNRAVLCVHRGLLRRADGGAADEGGIGRRC
jgi:hypothetical protein